MPVYLPPEECANGSGITVRSQRQENDMTFQTIVDAQSGCPESLVVLRQTFHPGWTATVDGKPVETITVFPFYVAVKLETPGTHEIIFSYRPPLLKKILALMAFAGIVWFVFAVKRQKHQR